MITKYTEVFNLKTSKYKTTEEVVLDEEYEDVYSSKEAEPIQWNFYIKAAIVILILVTLVSSIVFKIMFRKVGDAPPPTFPINTMGQTAATTTKENGNNSVKKGGIYYPTSETTTETQPWIIYTPTTIEEDTVRIRILNPDTPEEIAEARRRDAQRQAELAPYYTTTTTTKEYSEKETNLDAEAITDEILDDITGRIYGFVGDVEKIIGG